MTELSVIVPTYGRVTKIKNAIESILSNGDFEVIVVDDNGVGTENQLNTELILSSFIEREQLKYYPLEENSGAGIARNFAISKASGEYITFLDDDDFFIEGKLLDKLNFFKENSENYDICCSHMEVKNNGNSLAVKDDKFIGKDARTFLLEGSCYTSMIMIKKSAIEKIDGFYDTPYLQDHTLMLKAFLYDFKVCVFESSIFVHTVHDGLTITTGRRPIAGVELRCKLEQELATKLCLSNKERNTLDYRWNTIKYHGYWLKRGRSFSLLKFLLTGVAFRSKTKSEILDSLKLLVKFLIGYQYYTSN
ncbi:glycosyltransferase family 2 protein [Pseudoalteromonas arctica]|uniref:glycosyltransferase family 2 protein n=1 Tax=Pseudoalteromonas arctica TaxID=394751 RepID=UPI002494A238|nr:glycosyltransferase family 2 protein [Pseudoalteromonas arctica]